MNKLTMGSLFDGIAGFPYAGNQVGIDTLWSSEIDPYCEAVTKHHFPDVVQLGDITKINGAVVPPVDIIAFGSPCQNLSCAGNRSGLDGEKSSLFFEATRIIKEMLDATNGEYPKYTVWENVPGAFSSNGGRDITCVLNELQDLGYVIDMNVFDAQEMGVPQRRKRIYLVGIHANYIAQMKTSTSWSIITQLLTEILLSTSAEALNLSEDALKKSGFSQGISKDGLQKRMRLFGIEKTERHFEILLQKWAEVSLNYLKEQECSDVLFRKLDAILKADIHILESVNQTVPENLYGNISKLWNIILEDHWNKTNSSITSTGTNKTTISKISGCAILVETIALLIDHLKNFYPALSETESLISTWRKVFTNYVRESKTSRKVSNELGWIFNWYDSIQRIREEEKHFVADFGGERAGEILFKPEGLCWNPSQSGAAWEGVAADVEGSVNGSVYNESGQGYWMPDFGCLRAEGENRPTRPGHCVVQEVKCLNPHDPQTMRVYDASGLYPAVTANASGGQNRQAVLIIQGDIARGAHFGQNGKGYSEESISYTLNTIDVPAIAYGVDCRNATLDEEKTHTIQAHSTSGTSLNCTPSVCYASTGYENIIEGSPALRTSGRDCGGGFEALIMTTGQANAEIAHGISTTLTSEAHEQPICVHPKITGTICASGAGMNRPAGQGNETDMCIVTKSKKNRKYIIRRLTPLECEKLQGFPSNWTQVTYKNKPMSDSARYRMCGNSVAIPCVVRVLGGIVESSK